jgi:hypothetical protein
MSGKTHNLTATGVGGWGTATFDSSVDESPATLDYGFTLHVECIMVAGKLTPTVKQNGLFGPYGCILNPTNPPDALPVTIFSCNPFHARAGPFPIIAGGGGGCGGVGQNLYVDLFG